MYFICTHSNVGRYWLEKKNQQNVLVEFAAALGINPLVADSWYSVNPDLFYSSKVCLFLYSALHPRTYLFLDRCTYSAILRRESHKGIDAPVP